MRTVLKSTAEKFAVIVGMLITEQVANPSFPFDEKADGSNLSDEHLILSRSTVSIMCPRFETHT